jgi:hypothetical protein
MITLASKLIMSLPVIGAAGQALYATAGSFNWTCPASVTSVCVVTIGAGGGGVFFGNGTYSMAGGAGGGLGWINNYTVIPGNTYALTVGAAGQAGAYVSGSTVGGVSNFISSSTVSGGGGNPGRYNQAITGGGFVGDGGGQGGGVYVHNSSGNGPQGGGGAGGYSGAGGFGGYRIASQATRPTNGSGGGGAGGGNNNTNTGYGGGGVGVFGEGTNGVADFDNVGGGGSGGGDGSARNGGAYGGGGGGGTSNVAGTGSGGAVRIIWGTGRSFPSTGTTDV